MDRSHVVFSAGGAAAALLLVGLVAAQSGRATPPADVNVAPPRSRAGAGCPSEEAPVVPRQATRAAPATPQRDLGPTAEPAPPAPAALLPSDAPPRATRARERGIDELVAALEAIKARKAELDRAEKETVAMLQEKLRQQGQRLQKLGVAGEATPPTLAPTYSVPVQPSTSSYAVPLAPQVGPPASADGPLPPPMVPQSAASPGTSY